MGSRDQNRGLSGPRLNFTLLSNCFAIYPNYHPRHICETVIFQGSTCPAFIENIYFLNSHSFQASSHQYLQIKYIYFVNFLWMMTTILPLVPKNFSRGHHVWERFERLLQLCRLIFNVWMQFGTISFVFLCFATTARKVWSRFEAHRQDIWKLVKQPRSIMAPWLNPKSKLTIRGIIGPECTFFQKL